MKTLHYISIAFGLVILYLAYTAFFQSTKPKVDQEKIRQDAVLEYKQQEGERIDAEIKAAVDSALKKVEENQYNEFKEAKNEKVKIIYRDSRTLQKRVNNASFDSVALFVSKEVEQDTRNRRD